MKFIDPDLALRLVITGGWLLAALGILKLLFYALGELLPGFYKGIKSDSVRKFLTGNSNRLIFGLGGFVTVILGVVFVGLGLLLRRLNDLF